MLDLLDDDFSEHHLIPKQHQNDHSSSHKVPSDSIHGDQDLQKPLPDLPSDFIQFADADPLPYFSSPSTNLASQSHLSKADRLEAERKEKKRIPNSKTYTKIKNDPKRSFLIFDQGRLERHSKKPEHSRKRIKPEERFIERPIDPTGKTEEEYRNAVKKEHKRVIQALWYERRKSDPEAYKRIRGNIRAKSRNQEPGKDQDATRNGNF